MKGITSVEVVEMIRTKNVIGTGEEKDPVREVVQYWDRDGNLIKTEDPTERILEKENIVQMSSQLKNDSTAEAVKIAEQILKREKAAAKESTKQELGQVPIDPECYIAREIRYQTAILKDIQHQLDKKRG